MVLLSLINMIRSVFTKDGFKSNKGEHFSNLTNNQTICTGSLCACTWKPGPSQPQYIDNREQLRQNVHS